MKLVKILSCIFLYSFLVLTGIKPNSWFLHTEELANRNVLVMQFMHSV